MKKWLAVTIIYVMCFGIVTSLRMTQPPQHPERRLKTTDVSKEPDERFFHARASRASSRHVVASAPIDTPPTTAQDTIPTTTAPLPKPTSTVPSKATVSTTSKPRIPGGDIWAKLANCESSMNQRATSATGKYLGYFQFSMATWQSVGGPGDPRDHSYEVQLHYAQKLQARSGWGQWPRCSRKLGLR